MPDSYCQIAGWDIGGAHVKLAFIKDGQLLVRQWDCPLWKGLDELISVFKLAVNEIPNTIVKHNVTMTGELVDIFASHNDGVEKIILSFIEYVANQDNANFFSSKGLLTLKQALNNKEHIASANWIASAQLVAQNVKNAVFVDIGSTTTDVLHINNNTLVRNGMTDFDRLVSGELVYTGVVRSCVNTICREIPYKTSMVPLMAEYFCTSADVYRVLGWLPGHADYGSTMDGRAKDKVSSMTRLARMIGKDYSPDDNMEWNKASEYIAGQQMQMIEKSIMSILNINPGAKTIVSAGVGSFLVNLIAERLSLDCVDFAKCIVPDDVCFTDIVSDCAPAAALVFINSNFN